MGLELRGVPPFFVSFPNQLSYWWSRRPLLVLEIVGLGLVNRLVLRFTLPYFLLF